MGPYPGGPHGRKINTCAKGGIGCRRSRSRRQWKHAEEERGTRKKTEKRKEKKKRKKERQKRAIVRAERLTTHRNHVSVEQRDQGEAARPSPRERRQGTLPRSGNAVEATVSPRSPGFAPRADVLGAHGLKQAACVCVQSSSLADDSTPSARTQASPHGLLPNPQLIYSAIGPSEGYVSPMGPYPGGPTWTKNKYLREGGDRM